MDAHNLATDLDRMDDDGSPLPHAVLTMTPRLTRGNNQSAGQANATNDYYRRLGASYRRRGDAVRRSARRIEERDGARQLACYRRWPAIVDAMRTLISHYNDGAGREIVTLAEGATERDREPTVTVTACGRRTLVIALEGADVWVRASQTPNGRVQGERWIGLNRTDEATANYVLQNWLEELGVDDSAIRGAYRDAGCQGLGD